MSKALSEQKVLEKLGIEDFYHLTKDKVIKMASMIDKMDPEVAKKALEQFPDFANTAKEMLSDYKSTLDTILETNKESVQAFYGTCNSMIESLQKQLEVESLTFDERKYIIDKMLEISKMIESKDSENKKFLVTLALIGATAVGVITAILASVLGENAEADTYDTDELP